MGTVYEVDFRDPYADDIPSAAMMAWLRRAQGGGELPVLNEAGHHYNTKTIRSCEFRGWVKEISETDEPGVSLWRITASGRRAVGRLRVGG